MKLSACLAAAFAFLPATLANTEKVIFVAPAVSKLPDSKPATDFLKVRSLSHESNTIRTTLKADFASEAQQRGVDHWYLLRGLHENQRYELRVCWAATQPTNFKLDVHTISNVFDDPNLIQNLAKVVQLPQPKAQHAARSEGEYPQPGVFDSVLFLHIQAAADYFSSNQTLMTNPPDVNVDIILDPYAANIFPQSLVSTAGYLVAIATAGWVVSQVVWLLIKPANIAKSHND